VFFLNIFKYKFISLLLIFVFLVTDGALGAPVDVTIMDVGQGNCNIIRHHDRALIYDAGSSERRTSSASEKYFEEKGILETGRSYILKISSEKKVKEVAEEESDSREGKKDRSGSDGSKSSFGSVGKGDIDLGTDEVTRAIVKRIHDKLDGVDDITVVVSHADSDHYKLLNRIFHDKSELKDKINHIVLGGFRDSYMNPATRESKFETWLKEMEHQKKVLFTGYKDDHVPNDASPNDRHNPDIIAPPYMGGDSKPKAVQIIEDSLLVGEDVEPAVSVLSMNAGHAFRGDRAIVLNPSDNMNSIVVRVSHGADSVLLTGDVNAASWDHMKELWKEGELKSSIMVLSHHGGVSLDYGNDSYGTTSEISLSEVNPSVVLVSSGHVPKYGHPTMDAQSLVVDYLRAKKNRTDKHYVHYFDGSVFKRRLLDIPYFSTFSSGDTSFKLEPERALEFQVARGRSALLAHENGGEQFEKTSKGYDSEAALKGKFQDHEIHIWEYDGEKRSTIIPETASPTQTGNGSDRVDFLHITPKEGPAFYREIIKTAEDEQDS